MYYPKNIMDTATALRHQFGEIPFLEESIYQMTQTKKTVYIVDTTALLSEQAKLLFALFQRLLSSGGRSVLLVSSQLETLRNLVRDNNRPEVQEKASFALEELNRLAGRKVLAIFDVPSTASENLLEYWKEMMTSFVNEKYAVVLITQNRKLASYGNYLREFADMPVTTLYLLKDGFLRTNNSLPPLPAIPQGRPTPVEIKSEMPQPPYYLEGESTPLSLGKSLGNGSEGSVYEWNKHPDMVVKIFRCIHKKDDSYSQKLRELSELGANGKNPSICLPCQVVVNSSGDVIGVLMRKLKGVVLDDLFQQEDRLKELFPDRLAITQLAHRIFVAVYRLALHGIYPMDLKCSNIMVDEKGDITLFDLDSCQYRCYPGLTASEETTPPELGLRNLRAELRGEEEFHYALTAVLFQVLHLGLGQFATVGEEHPSFVFAKDSYPSHLERESMIFNTLSQSTKELFRQSLRERQVGDPPRPNALSLYSAILREECCIRSSVDGNIAKLYPDAPKAARRQGICTCCKESKPINYLVQYRPHALCKDCREQVLELHCETCQRLLGVTLEQFLASNAGSATLPRFCRACSSMQRLHNSSEPLTRPIQQQDHALAQKLLSTSVATRVAYVESKNISDASAFFAATKIL